MSRYYIKNLNKPSSSDTRKRMYLPVRYSPAENIPKLNLGWDDENYLLLNNEGQLVKFTKEDCDGIELPTNTEVEVVEIVQGLTGIWYGFIFVSAGAGGPLSMEQINLWTADETKILYARPYHFVKLPGTTEILISNNLTKKEVENPKAEFLKGTKLISPGSNLNWKKLEKYDVKLAYFDFNQFNRKNAGENLFIIDEETILQNPTYRYSEGLYYFISDDGSRKTAEELDVLGREQEDQEQIKAEQSSVLAEEVKSKAFNTLLRYLNKNTEDTSMKSILQNTYFVNVSSYVTTNFSNPKNQKILFAIPASYIDALPDSDLEYGSNFNSNYVLDAPFVKGRNYSFTMKLSEIEDNVDDLVSIFKDLKSKIESFKQSGGVVKNSNNIDYDIDQQIEEFEKFPAVINQFMTRQASAHTTDDDYISKAVRQGTDTDEDHILQIDIRDNGVIGSGVRETISSILFSPDNKYLSEGKGEGLDLYELDPWILDEELTNTKKAKRSGVDLRKAIPWLRSKFQGVQGSRTLHYLMAQKSMINFSNQANKSDIKLNEWIKFLQSFTVPPLLIQLTKDKKSVENKQEEVDCVKLLEEFAAQGPVLTAAQRDRHQAILNSPQCREAWRKAKQKDTSTFESTFTKAAVLGQSEVVGDVTQDFSGEALKSIYEGLLHNLNPQALMALLLSCIQSRLGIEMTAEGLCRAAIEGIIKEIGGDAFLESLKEADPNMNVDSISSFPPQAPATSSNPDEDVIFRDSPIAKSVYLTTGNLRAAKNIEDVEYGGGIVETIPAEYTTPDGESRTFSENRLITERSNLISLGFSDEQSSALMIQKGLLKTGPSQVNYVEAEYDLFTQNRRYDGVSDYGDAVETSLFIDELISLNGLEALCEAIVGPLLDLPGNFLADPEGYIQEFRFPDFNIPTISMPDSLSTDDMIGNYGDTLMRTFLGLIGSMIGQLLSALLQELIESCFEEPELPGRDGLPRRKVTLPLPSFSYDSLDLGIPPDKAKDWINDLLNNFTPSQICALLKGEASHSTIEAILERTREHNSNIFGEANLESAVDIITTFKKIGKNINLDICNLASDALPAFDAFDACDASYDYDARCAELQAAGLTQEECEKQIKDELEDLKNKILALSSFLFPNSNPLDGVVPDPCGPQGIFVLPPAVKNSMAELTDHILTYIKRSLIEDLKTLEFFSLPPRAVMAAVDPDEMASATSALVDMTSEEAPHVVALAYIGGGQQGYSGGYKTTEVDYHLTYSATNHFIEREGEEEFLMRFKPGSMNGPKGDLNILDSETFEPLTYLNFGDSSDADLFRILMQHNFSSDKVEAIHKIASSIGINPDLFYNQVNETNGLEPGLFDRTENARQDFENAYDKWFAAHEARIALEESYHVFINKEDSWEVEMEKLEEKLQTAEAWGVIAASVLSYALSLNPAHLLLIIETFWEPLTNIFDEGRELVDPAFAARNALREKNFRRQWANNNIKPHIDEQKLIEASLVAPRNAFESVYQQEEQGLREIINKIGQEVKNVTKQIPLPMGVENYYFTLEMFYFWLNFGVRFDEETGSLLFGDFPLPYGIGYEPLREPVLVSDETHYKPFFLNAAAGARPDDSFGWWLSFSLYTPLKDIDPKPHLWRNLLRMFTGMKEPSGVFSSDDLEVDDYDDIESEWIVHPANARSVNTGVRTPGLDHLARLAQSYNNNVIAAFMNMSVGDACGLSTKRRRSMYPKLRDRLTGVVFQKSEYRFDYLALPDFTITIHNWERLMAFLTNEGDPEALGGGTLAGYLENNPDQASVLTRTMPLLNQIVIASTAYSDLVLSMMYAQSLANWPRDLLEHLSSLQIISYEQKYISIYGGARGYVPVFGTFKKYIRDADNPWEQGTKSLIEATSLENRLVNEKLYEKLTNNSIYPMTFDSTYHEKLGDHIKIVAQSFKWSSVPSSAYGGNFNSNVLKYDLPDNNIISSDPAARLQVAQVMEIYKKSLSPSPSIEEALENLRAVNTNKTLVYQNTLIPRGQSYLVEADGLQDLSSLIKGKIAEDSETPYADLDGDGDLDPVVGQAVAAIAIPTELLAREIHNETGAPLNKEIYKDGIPKIVTINDGDTYTLQSDELLYNPQSFQADPPEIVYVSQKSVPPYYIQSDESILESKYNFSIQNTYDEDIQKLLLDIGLESSEKFDEKFEHLNGWFSTSVSDLKLNSKAIVFAQLLKHKLKNVLEDYSKDTLSPELLDKRELLLNKIMFGLSTHGYSSLQFAYSNQMFVKLKNSRLHYRKYLRKLWKKILKSPYISNDVSEQCDKIFRDLGAAAGAKRNETDFFDLDSVKPSIMEFYQNSICRDVYDKSPEGHNAVKDSLLEGGIMLLIKVYVLEMCLASIISWDSFDIGDIFSDRIMVKIVVDNMRKDINNFELLIKYANDIIRKVEDTEDQELFLLTNKISSIEYLIMQESKQITKTIKSMFVNSNPFTTEIDLDITLTTDQSPLWTEKEKIFYNNIATTGNIPTDQRESGYQYVTDVRFTNNIYTMNYGGVLEGPRGGSPYTAESTAKWIYSNNSEVSSRIVDLFGMKKILPAQGASQRLAFHSLPVTNHRSELISESWPDKWQITSPWHPNAPLDETVQYTREYYSPSKALKEVSCQDQNRYETLFANEYNSRLGNVVFQPYVRIVDSTLADIQGMFVKYSSFGQTPPGEPCDDPPALDMLQLTSEITLPFLGWYRNENNLFGCKIYDYVPLEVWNYFYNNVFLKELEDKPKYKAIFEQYGLKPFFKEVKFGIRMSYSIEDETVWTPGDYEKIVDELVGRENLKRVKTVHNMRRAASRMKTQLTRWVFAEGIPMPPAVNISGLERIQQLQSAIATNNATLQDIVDLGLDPLAMAPTITVLEGMLAAFQAELDALQGDGPSYSQPNPQDNPLGTIGNYVIVAYTNADGEILYIHRDVSPSDFELYKEKGEIVDAATLVGQQTGIYETDLLVDLKSEMQIPIVEVERDLELLPTGFRYAESDLVSYGELGYYAADKEEISQDATIAQLISLDYSEAIKSAINCPSQFFYKNIAQDLFREVKETPEFRLMYNHLFPMKRYMSLAFLYSGDSLSKFIPEPTEVLYETKTAILQVLDGLLTSDSYTYDPDEGSSSLDSALNYGALGTRAENAPEPDITSMLLKMIFMTPLLILKGLVEIADPAISISKKIIDIAVAVSAAVIAGIETGLRVSKAVAEQAKLVAQTVLANAEIGAQSAGIPVTASWNMLDKIEGGTELKEASFGPDAELDLTGDVELWVIPQEKLASPPTEESPSGGQPNYDIPPAAEEAFSQLMDGLEALETAKIAYSEAAEAYKVASDEVDFIAGQLDDAVAKAKEVTNAAFSSPFALQAVWTSFLPSTLPFFGGLVPFGGPPSTLPGMIYLALMYLDMVEMKQHDDSQFDEEEDCEEQL